MLIKYFDNASTTKLDNRVLKEMLPYFNEIYGNASSNHDFGKKAKYAIEKSRRQVSKLIVIKTKQISINTEVNKYHLLIQNIINLEIKWLRNLNFM